MKKRNKGWASRVISKAMQRARKIEINPICKKCPHREKCDGNGRTWDNQILPSCTAYDDLLNILTKRS